MLINLVYFTASTASTTIVEKKFDSGPMSFDDIDVLATLMRASLPRSATESARVFWIYAQASLAAILYPAMIFVGWTLFLMSSFARLRSSEAKITTEVVPSPTSLS